MTKRNPRVSRNRPPDLDSPGVVSRNAPFSRGKSCGDGSPNAGVVLRKAEKNEAAGPYYGRRRHKPSANATTVSEMVDGSGMIANRMLSTANAGAAVELNVNSTRSNGIVL
jgi:hypothetical protein